MDTIGHHYIAEASGCTSGVIGKIEAVERILVRAPEIAGVHVWSTSFHRFNPSGGSGVFLISGSHMSGHTWPEVGYAALDIFTFGDSAKPQKALQWALKASVAGEVRFDPTSRALYSTDASIYQILPLGVVIPRDDNDVAATLRIAADAGTPILPRGAGTSLAGQAIGRAIIVDCSKYMSRIVELDAARPQARVQPGVVQDDLNQAARSHGLRLGPDTATSNRAT